MTGRRWLAEPWAYEEAGQIHISIPGFLRELGEPINPTTISAADRVVREILAKEIPETPIVHADGTFKP